MLLVTTFCNKHVESTTDDPGMTVDLWEVKAADILKKKKKNTVILLQDEYRHTRSHCHTECNVFIQSYCSFFIIIDRQTVAL